MFAYDFDRHVVKLHSCMSALATFHESSGSASGSRMNIGIGLKLLEEGTASNKRDNEERKKKIDEALKVEELSKRMRKALVSLEDRVSSRTVELREERKTSGNCEDVLAFHELNVAIEHLDLLSIILESALKYECSRDTLEAYVVTLKTCKLTANSSKANDDDDAGG
jgi:hypothetical protein